MNPDPTPAKPVKRTRRRLRLSCVECTKRRQKCDRTYPCGLCQTRGVAHLCRWESVPVSRPTPARPPAHARAMSDSEDKIKIHQLSQRISVLERALEHYASTNGDYSDSGFLSSPSQSPSSQHSVLASPSPSRYDEADQLHLVNQYISATASSIAPVVPLSVGTHQEFLGSGSSLHTLRQIGSSSADYVSRAQNADPSSSIFMKMNFGHDPIQLGSVIGKIPSATTTHGLLTAYFQHADWSFGLPQNWIYAAVARTLGVTDTSSDSCLNPHWLCLFFALLASAPRHDTEPSDASTDQLFACSVASMRIAEEMYETTSGFMATAALIEGIVLTSLAAPLLSKRYAASGRLSEGWKLLGHRIRIAESVGLHRDPSGTEFERWSDEEKSLRRIAWSNLAIWDRLYSLLLSRPSMSDRRFCNVHPDFMDYATGAVPPYLPALLSLSQMAEDINATHLADDHYGSRTIYELELQLDYWYRQLPFDYSRSVKTGASRLQREEYSLFSWYLYLKIKMHVKCAGNACALAPGTHASTQKSCISLCLELIEMQCDAYESRTALSLPETITGKIASTLTSPLPSLECSEYLFMALEAAVALSLRLDRLDHQQSTEVRIILHRACALFDRLNSQQGKLVTGNLPYAGLTILQAFLRAEPEPHTKLERNSGDWAESLPSDFRLDIHDASPSTVAGSAEPAQSSELHTNVWSSMMDPAYIAESVTPIAQQFPYSNSQHHFESSWKG